MQQITLLLILFLFLFSCGQTEVAQKEPQPKESEIVLPEKDTSSIPTPVAEVNYTLHNPCTFSIKLPSDFKAEPMEEENSLDYCDYSVKTKDGFEIMQLHSLLGSKFETSAIKELYEEALTKSELEITYKAQKGNWFVISGTNKTNGNAVYWKRISGNNFVSDLHIEYPKSRETEIVPYIGAIAGSFTSD